MSFVRKSILVSSSGMIGVLLTFVGGIIYSRVLGPDGVGQYRLFQTTSTIVATIAAMGIGNASVYFLNNRGTSVEKITTNLTKFVLAVGVLLSVALSAMFLGLPWYFGRVSAAIAIILAVSVGAQLGSALLQQVLLARLEVRRMVTVSLTQSALLFVGGMVLALLGWLNIETALLVIALSAFAGFSLVLAYVRRHIRFSIPFDWRLFSSLLLYGIKLAAASLFYLLSFEISVILLRYLLPDDFGALGLYTRAMTISSLIVLVPRGLASMLFAKWSGTEAVNRPRQVEMSVRLSIIYSVLACLPILIFPEFILRILYGAEFTPAARTLRILVPSAILLPIFIVCSSMLAGDGRAAVTAWISAVSVILIGVTTYVLVDSLKLGIQGAAVGALCGNGFTALASFVICCSRYGLRARMCVVPRVSDLRYVWRAVRLGGIPAAGAGV